MASARAAEAENWHRPLARHPPSPYLPGMAGTDARHLQRPICHIVLVKSFFLCTVCWRKFEMKDGAVEDECHEGGDFTITIRPKRPKPQS